jgi:hypothetical protein
MPDGVVVNSFAAQRFHQRLGYRPKRWEYIPNGIDTREMRPDDESRRRVRGELGIAGGTIAIGMAARYHPMKDHANFLAAYAADDSGGDARRVRPCSRSHIPISVQRPPVLQLAVPWRADIRCCPAGSALRQPGAARVAFAECGFAGRRRALRSGLAGYFALSKVLRQIGGYVMRHRLRRLAG